MAPALSISIPSTSLCSPSNGKAFTQYHIVLQLPLRKHEVKKRYSDFAALHSKLTSQTGAAPPAPLPAKSWFRQTLNSAALIEDRRKDLEQYLKAILEADDTRWRSSEAWKSFLNLPLAKTSGPNSFSTHSTTNSSSTFSVDQAALTDPNQWLDKHRELKTQIQTARHHLKQRDTATSSQEQHTSSTEAKASLIRAATAIALLDDALKQVTSSNKGNDDSGWNSANKLGAGETRRRRDLLAAARSEVEGLEGVLRSVPSRNLPSSTPSFNQPMASDSDKAGLWQGTQTAVQPRGRVLGGGGGGALKETERTRELGNNGVVQLQRQVLKEQDEDVLSLGKTVARLKDMGLMINEELTIQNEMLGLLEEDTDRVQGKIDVGRRRINKIR